MALGKLSIGPDLPKIVDLLVILERNIGRLRRDLSQYESTGKMPKTAREVGNE